MIESSYLHWPGVQQLIRLERQAIEKSEVHSSVKYGIASASRKKADAGFLLQSSRGRWGIENRCFYLLDVALGKDVCRVRTGSAVQNLSRLCHALLNLARNSGPSVGSLCREHALKPHLLLHRLCIFKNWPAMKP